MRAIWHGLHWGFGFGLGMIWAALVAVGVVMALDRLLDLAGLL